jgi:hypothetical protein
MKKLLYIIPISLIIIIGFVAFWPTPTTLAATDKRVSIGLSTQYEDTPGVLSDWTIKFEPSGTCVNKEYIRIRLDLYPSPGSLSYDSHRIYSVDYDSPEWLAGYPGKMNGIDGPTDPFDYQKWFDTLPHEWVTTPALCYLLRVPYDISIAGLSGFILQELNIGVISTLDNILIDANREHLLSAYWYYNPDKIKYNDAKAPPLPSTEIINTINSRLEGFEITGAQIPANGEFIKPMSISIGSGAIDRVTQGTPYTIIDKGNPANATGTLTSVSIYVNSNLGALSMATFYLVSGTNYSTRDYVDLGNTLTGLITFSPVSIDTTLGDYLGYTCTTGYVDRDTTGTNMCWYDDGDMIPCTNNTFFVYDMTYSLSGTGTESGGTPSITNSPSSKAFGVIWPSSTYWSNTGNSTGFTDTLDDAEAYFTITNDGDTTIAITITGTNWTGGVGWNIVQAGPGENQIRLSAFKEGDNASQNVTLTTSAQSFIASLAASGNTTDWEIKLETGTSFTDGVAKTGTITLTAAAS